LFNIGHRFAYSTKVLSKTRNQIVFTTDAIQHLIDLFKIMNK